MAVRLRTTPMPPSSWERERDARGFFLQFWPDGYAVGINALLHAMTH